MDRSASLATSSLASRDDSAYSNLKDSDIFVSFYLKVAGFSMD